MNTYKTSDLIILYTCKSKLVSMATKTGLLRNRKPTLAGVLVYAVIKMKEKQINASSATIIYISHLTLPGFTPCPCSGWINAGWPLFFFFLYVMLI